MDQAPILSAASPLFRDVHHGQIQHFQKAVIGWEHGFSFGHLAKLTIEFLNGIGRVNQPPHFLGIFEVGAEIGPVVPSGLRNPGVFLVPMLCEGVQGVQCCRLIYCGVDRFQIGHKGFQILGSNSPFRSRKTNTSTSPKLVHRVLLLCPFRLLSVSLFRQSYLL